MRNAVEEGTQNLHYCGLGDALHDDLIPTDRGPEATEIKELVERCQQIVEK